MDYVSISVRTQRQSVGGGGCTLLDADGFKLLPLFSIRHEAVTSLICAAAALAAALMFRVNELSAHRSASSSRLRCCYANHGAAQASSTFCRSPLGVQLPTASHGPGRPCMWSRLFPAALFEDAGADSPGCYPNTCPDLLTSGNMQIRHKCVGSTSRLIFLHSCGRMWSITLFVKATSCLNALLFTRGTQGHAGDKDDWHLQKYIFFLRLKLNKRDKNKKLPELLLRRPWTQRRRRMCCQWRGS